MKNENEVGKRKRKALLLLPLFVIPFLTLGFWALGGGRGATGITGNGPQGLNMQLPNAQLRDEKGENKMSFYEMSERDSARWKEALKNDPSYELPLTNKLGDTTYGSNNTSRLTYDPSPKNMAVGRDPNEEKVYQKLAELNQQLASSPVNHQIGFPQKVVTDLRSKNTGSSSEEVDRLDAMMKTMNNGDGVDPEMVQVNAVMDKILDIQHPGRVKERMEEKSVSQKNVAHSSKPFAVKASVSLLDTPKKVVKFSPGFFSLEEEEPTIEENSIRAVIHQKQTLVSGSVVKLRLLQDMEIKGSLIPKETFVFGIATLNGERLEMEITSIRNKSSIYPVKLEVYDMDGLPGIYIPGAITRDVAKQSADNSLQMLELSTLDPSLKAQVTGAGLSAVKSLLSKKTKQVKVAVKAGYQVLLRDKMSQ